MVPVNHCAPRNRSLHRLPSGFPLPCSAYRVSNGVLHETEGWGKLEQSRSQVPGMGVQQRAVLDGKEISIMFYIERSEKGPFMCRDLHDCLGMSSKGLGWFRDGSIALAFPTKDEAEAFCKSHNLSLDADKNGYEPRYVIVEEIRLPEVQDIAAKYGALCNGNELFLVWGEEDFRVQIVKNTDVSQFPFTCSQTYEYVVGARLVKITHGSNASKTIIEEIHNPSYKQLDEFVAKCVREHKV